MTREEIIELAKQHGAVTEVLAMGRSDGVLFTPLELEAFFHAAQKLEREACANVADGVAQKYQREHYATAENVADECAAAIRNRGNQ